MKLAIFEILELAEKQKNRIEKAKVLKENESQLLLAIFDSVYNPATVWALPEGVPPGFKFNTIKGAEMQLFTEARKFYLFISGMRDDIPQMKREIIFNQMLEVLHPRDAELMVYVKDKRLPPWAKSITEEVVRFTFPELLPVVEK